MTPSVSLILTTYNWPEALSAVLDTIRAQRQIPLEVLIADDGSSESTRQCIARYRRDFPCPVIHVWHEDHGYQAAKIRNKTVERATGDYLIFLDSDCLLRPDFVECHARLARPGHFVAGNRVLLSEAYTREVLAQNIKVTDRSPFSFRRDQVNRRWSMLNLPMGVFRRLRPRSWKGVKACNMSMYRADFIAANGFEENFEGWGYEDSDLIVRLLNAGLRRTSGRFATTVIHLWHSSNKSLLEEGNWIRLQETIKSARHKAVKGLEQRRTRAAMDDPDPDTSRQPSQALS